MENKKSVSALYSWKLKDVILVSMMSVSLGVMYLSADYVVQFVRPLFDLLGLGLLAMEAVFGIWFIGNTLAMYIMRKPGIALVTGILSAAVQLPMGSPWGAIVIASGLLQGLGAELVFFLFRYKKFNWGSMFLAAAVCAFFSLILDWYLGFLAEFSLGFLAARFLVRVASAMLFAGVVSKVLADALAKAGVLKSYPIGAKRLDDSDPSDTSNLMENS
ncbi:MAG: ECF transporter S component [Treponema sp.]|nr:ECF transporter S component [Treponema sp.]